MHARTHVRTWSQHAFVRGHFAFVLGTLPFFFILIAERDACRERDFRRSIGNAKELFAFSNENESKPRWTEKDVPLCVIDEIASRDIELYLSHLLFFPLFFFPLSDKAARDAKFMTRIAVKIQGCRVAGDIEKRRRHTAMTYAVECWEREKEREI